MSPQIKPQRYILIDTNIFHHLGQKDLYPQIISLLGDALSKGYGLSMSSITLLELLDTASIENEMKAMTATKGIKHFQVSKSVLIAAGHLGCMYMDDGVDKMPEKPDKIIAATSVLNNAVIFTTNGRDFPVPFFKIISTPTLMYKKSDGREVKLISYFLEPDLNIIGTKHNDRLAEHKEKFKKSKIKKKI